jgi:poly(3-hydroxybutyrate) depolymerase
MTFADGDPIEPVAKTIDGAITDWVGRSPMYGGTIVYSGGELVYQDHLFDAYGPDDGRDASRLAKTDPIEEVFPDAYRLDALSQADPSGELIPSEVPVPEEIHYDDTYGDAASGLQSAADLLEVRLAPATDSTALLARATTLQPDSHTALLVLVDNGGDAAAHAIPFDSGISSSTADLAYFLTGSTGLVADLTSASSPTPFAGSVATNPDGFTNAIEASLPFALAEGTRVAVASGTANATGDGFAALAIEQKNDLPHANLANVAFRTDEPPRVWFERNQALALNAGSMDGFFVSFDTERLAHDEVPVPGAAYHDRIFISSPNVAREGGEDGLYQHYGLFLPTSYDGTPTPLQWWLHWRGGSAHSGAGIVPKVFKQYGEDMNTIVVAPSGRGSSTWYVGRGHVDFLDVWNDVFDSFSIDRQRVYLSGHSMGGWGTYLMATVYPDRFAAGAPAAGPVTQGAWTGLDFAGCDQLKYKDGSDEYTPCYIQANGSNPRAQHTRKLLENTRYVPLAIMHGTDDELVPYSGVARQAQRLQELGFRFRLYTYPGYEHYSHPIMDQWAEQAHYMHQFVSPDNPAVVSYVRDMPFEHATETVQSGGIELNFSFDSAYWMSHLEATDEANGQAHFEGTSLAILEQPHVVVPDATPPTSAGSTGPFVMAGQAWLPDPIATAPATRNGFTATLDGARAVQLDLARMQIDSAARVSGTVDTENPLDLHLSGGWAEAPVAYVDGINVTVAFAGGVATIQLSPGVHSITVEPGFSILSGPNPL